MWALQFLVYALIVALVGAPFLIITVGVAINYYFAVRDDHAHKMAEKNVDLLARFMDKKVASGQIFSDQEGSEKSSE